MGVGDAVRMMNIAECCAHENQYQEDAMCQEDQTEQGQGKRQVRKRSFKRFFRPAVGIESLNLMITYVQVLLGSAYGRLESYAWYPFSV